jgi:phosphatidylethanolamine/phosphatidyl-N-methylethanolamine N-methyltransferase
MPLSEYTTFFRQFRQRFETTGAIAPSSRFLASAMARPLKQRADDAPVRVLEIGPGTGAVTRTLVKHIREGDRFDLVELNEAFAEMLNTRFDNEPAWKRVREQSQVHVVPIQEFDTEEPYDFVISGLPLNNFPTALVDEIFEAYFRLLKPGGVLSYFEYQFVRSIRTRVGKRQERDRLTTIDSTMKSYTDRLRFRRDWIFVNLPPAWVQHLRATPQSSDADQPSAGEAPA